MQIQITPTPAKNQILFCKVDCYDKKNIKTCSLKMIMGSTEEMTLARIQRKFPKCKPVLIKAKILKEWE